MTTTLLLMRHGKAKTIVEGQQDFDRELSEAGRRSLAAMLPQELLQLDSSCGSVEVWASPAVRTQQTAEVLVRALKKRGIKPRGGIQEVDSLWNQDDEQFLEEVRECSADTVIAVGHNPFIEDVLEDLTDSHIAFSTGAIGACRLNFQKPAQADDETASYQSANESGHRLLWFAQGPVSQRWRTLVTMEKTICKWIDAVFDRREAFIGDPDDIETMHKFRVSIRTLRSLIGFVKPWQDAGQNAAMQADLKDVVALTSRLRELDVLCEQARDEESASIDLVAFCEAEAKAERDEVYALLQSKKVDKALKRVRKESRAIIWKQRCREDGLGSAEVRGRFDELAEKLEFDLSELDLSEVEPTHDVRKRAKRVRYVAENFKDIIGSDTVKIAKGMTAHQDNLGAICDARVNIDIINAFEDRELPDPVAWDLALLRARNEMYLYTTLRDARAED